MKTRSRFRRRGLANRLECRWRGRARRSSSGAVEGASRTLGGPSGTLDAPRPPTATAHRTARFPHARAAGASDAQPACDEELFALASTPRFDPSPLLDSPPPPLAPATRDSDSHGAFLAQSSALETLNRSNHAAPGAQSESLGRQRSGRHASLLVQRKAKGNGSTCATAPAILQAAKLERARHANRARSLCARGLRMTAISGTRFVRLSNPRPEKAASV